MVIKKNSNLVVSKDINAELQEIEELIGKLYTAARLDALKELKAIIKKSFKKLGSLNRKKIISALITSLNGTQFWGGGFTETVADILVEIGKSAVPELVTALNHQERGTRFGVTLALYNMTRRYPEALKGISMIDLFFNPEPYIRRNPYDKIVSSYQKKAFNYWEISMALLEGSKIEEVLLSPRLGLIDREFNYKTLETYDSIDELVRLKLSSGIKSYKEAGRSLIIITDDDRTLVIKFLVDRPGMDMESRRPENLEDDARWMAYLRLDNPALSLKSDLPEPLVFSNNRYIFATKNIRLKDELLTSLGNVILDPDKHYYAICYLPDESYLIYLNDKGLQEKEFYQAALVNISDLAQLAVNGIFHSEPINLYHNLSQNTKYNISVSSGPGRVDKWLCATEYPNMRLSGIADFEHLSTVDSIEALHQAISNELFAWVLVVASYYRLKCLSKIDGKDLFQNYIRILLQNSFNMYYSVFAGTSSSELDRCVDWERLADEMTKYMMTDKWMHDKINPDLGKYNGKLPIEILVRAIYITTTLSILAMGSTVPPLYD